MATSELSLRDKLCAVTGVTSGIGRATAARLIEAEADVLGVGRDPSRLAEVASALGPRFSAVAADLSVPEQRGRVAMRLGSLGRALDVFVSNAAECVYESPLGVAPAALRRLFEINVFAPLELFQSLTPSMAPGGQIVQLSSVTARHLPNPKYGAYGASKTAIEQLVQALRMELQPKQIRVSLIVPGLVDTPIYQKVERFERALARLKEQVPTWLAAEDVADAILWVLSRPPHVAVSELTVMPRQQTR